MNRFQLRYLGLNHGSIHPVAFPQKPLELGKLPPQNAEAVRGGYVVPGERGLQDTEILLRPPLPPGNMVRPRLGGGPCPRRNRQRLPYYGHPGEPWDAFFPAPGTAAVVRACLLLRRLRPPQDKE